MNIHVRNGVISLIVAGVFAYILGYLPGGIGIGYLAGVLIGGFVFYILWNLSGNRKIAKASAQQYEQALSLTPPPGQALVYVVRQGFVAKMAGLNVAIDGVRRAQLKSPQFTCFAVAPGEHEIHAAFAGGAGAQNRAKTGRMTLEAGSVWGVLISADIGALKGELNFRVLPDEKLRQVIRKVTMVAPIEDQAGQS